MKASFLDNFKARVKIENVLRKYVRGYSKDKVRKKKIEEFYKTNSLTNFDSERLFYNSQYFNNTDLQVNNSFNKNNNDDIIYSNGNVYKKIKNEIVNQEENKTYHNKENNNVHVRLNNLSIGSKRRTSINDPISTKEIREKKEMEECSFKPKIKIFDPKKFNSLNSFYDDKGNFIFYSRKNT